jgi:hypothetical protein
MAPRDGDEDFARLAIVLKATVVVADKLAEQVQKLQDRVEALERHQRWAGSVMDKVNTPPNWRP